MSPIHMQDDRLREEFLRVRLPENDMAAHVMRRIGPLTPRRRQRRSLRVAAVVLTAALLLPFVAALLGLLPPAAASTLQRIPVIGGLLAGSILEFAGDSGVQSASRTATARQLEAQSTDSGITLTVREALYDGVRLVLGYTLESDIGATDLADLSVYADGGRIPEAGSSTGRWLNDRTYAGVLSLSPDPDATLPDRFTLRITSSSMFSATKGSQFVKGKWTVELPIVKAAALDGARTFLTPGVAAASGDGKRVEVKGVTFGPTGVELRIDSAGMGDALLSGYTLFDDRGMELEPLGGSGNTTSDGSSDFRYLYAPVPEIPPYLVLKPFTRERAPDEPVIVRRPYRSSDPLPVLLPQGEAGTVTVTGVDFQPDRTLIYYEVEGSAPFLQYASLWMETADGERIVQGGGDRKRTDDRDKYRYVMTYPALDPHDQYAFGTIELSGNRFIESLQVTIPLQSP